MRSLHQTAKPVIRCLSVTALAIALTVLTGCSQDPPATALSSVSLPAATAERPQSANVALSADAGSDHQLTVEQPNHTDVWNGSQSRVQWSRAPPRIIAVEAGNTLYGQSYKHGISVAALAEANRHSPNLTLKPCQGLLLPAAAR